jgi:hypothetical protein
MNSEASGTVEHAIALDVRTMHRSGLLPNARRCGGPLESGSWDARTQLQLPNLPHRPWVTVGIDLEGDSPFDAVRIDWPDGRSHRIPLVASAQHLGGRRWWLLCSCGGRFGVLYLARTRWACRTCLGLYYETCNLTDWERGLRVARRRRARIERRIGPLIPGVGYIPPPRMRRRTWQRLAMELQVSWTREADSVRAAVDAVVKT